MKIDNIMYNLNIGFHIDKQPTIHGGISGNISITLKNGQILNSDLNWDDEAEMEKDFSEQLQLKDYEKFKDKLNSFLFNVIENRFSVDNIKGTINGDIFNE